MDYYVFSSAFNCAACLGVSFFVLFTNRKRATNQWFIVFSSSVAFWSFGYTLWQISWVYDSALFWIRLAMVGSMVIPFSFSEFIVRLVKRDKSFRFLRLVNFFVSILVIAFSFHPLFISDLRPALRFRFWPVPGVLFYLFHASFALNVILSHILMIREWKKKAVRLKKQLILVFVATVIGFTGGMTNHFLWYGIKIPPFGNIAVSVCVLVMAYAIIAHHLMDIEVIVKRTIVFAGLFAMVMAVVAFVMMLSQAVLAKFVIMPPAILRAFGVILALLLYEPSKKLLMVLTDKYLFQKKEDFKVVLNRLAESIITILDIDQVGERILTTLKESLRLESGAIILRNEDDKAYRILNAFDVANPPAEYGREDFFVNYLQEHEEVINLEDDQQKKGLPIEVFARLQELNAVLCIPLFIHNDLIGILTLGKKKSDEEFTGEELDYLPTVASQAAVALSNARLYDILKKSQIDFAQQAKMAAIGTLSAGIGHEIKNPLGAIRMGVEMLKMNRKFGIYDKMTKEEYLEVVDDVIGRVIQHVDRATDVINRLSSFAKKPKELKIEPVNVEAAVENALVFLSNEFEHYGIAVIRNFQLNVPDIMADRHAMEDVFLNILINARHAMKEKGVITVSTLFREPEVEVVISDTGQGIAQENLDKIFDPFFTTKDTTRNSDPSSIKGSGLGLFIVREIVKKFSGRIVVESEIGKGTTFRLIFPTTIEAAQSEEKNE